MSDEHEKPSQSPDELRGILGLLRQTARGERASAGRDEVPGPTRLEIGGMQGRALACQASRPGHDAGALRLVAGAGEIVVRMTQKGEFIYTYGDLIIEAPDRERGAAFATAMADWLGTPLDPRRTRDPGEPGDPGDPGEPSRVIRGSYVKLGVRDDADGIRWDVFKLFMEGEHPAEVFFRVSADATRAAFTEKWSKYRAPLLVGFDRELGAGRAIAERTTIDVFGGVWFTVPTDWIATRLDESVKVTDPTDEAGIEVSHQPYPLHPRLPGLTERLLAAFSDRNVTADQVVAVDRGDLELVWTAYEYEATDTKTGDKRPARARALIAANDVLQALVTFAYWPADEGWAVSEWETIISTLRLAGHSRELVPDGSADTTDSK